jgi:hypothetical protein
MLQCMKHPPRVPSWCGVQVQVQDQVCCGAPAAVVLIQNLVFGDMMPCRFVLVCLDNDDGGSNLPRTVTVYQSIRRNIQEDFNHYCNVFPRPVKFSPNSVVKHAFSTYVCLY